MGSGAAYVIERKNERYVMRVDDREYDVDGQLLQAFSVFLRQYEVSAFEEKRGVPAWEPDGLLEIQAGDASFSMRIKESENGRHRIDFGDAALDAFVGEKELDGLLPPFARFVDRQLSSFAAARSASLVAPAWVRLF